MDASLKVPDIESYGGLRLTTPEGPTALLPCDRLSISRGGELYLAAFTANGTVVKAVRAFLNSTSKGHFEALGLDAYNEHGNQTNATDRMVRDNSGLGYRAYSHPLQFHQWHVAVVTKDPAFMPHVSHQSLWHTLMQPCYTTPMIKAWIPWVFDQLIEAGKLKQTCGFQTRSGRLSVTSAELDAIVLDGIDRGRLIIPEDD